MFVRIVTRLIVAAALVGCLFGQTQVDLAHQVKGQLPCANMQGGVCGPVPYALSPENFGAVGDGSTNDCTAFTNASAANTDIWLTPGKSYALSGTCTITGQVNITSNTSAQVPFIIKPAAVVTFNQPPNNGGSGAQMFTMQTTINVADTMARANENPMTDGGAWVVGSYTGTGLTAEAGQLVGNLYEQQTANATITGYVLWNASTFSSNPSQIATITLNTSTTATTCAVVRGSTANAGQYRFCVITALGNASTAQLSKVAVGGAVTNFGTCSPSSGIQSGDKISISASGQATTSLVGYLNGAPISACSFSDSSTPILSGLPGMVAFGSGTIANSKISGWSGATFDTGQVLFNANTTSVLPEWFGAKGDGLSTTDDSVPIQQCINSIVSKGGECFLAPKIYNTLNTVYINASLISLRGAPVGAYGPFLRTPSPTMNIVQVQGVSGGLLQYDVLQDFSVARTLSGTGLGTGIYFNFVQWTHTARVNSFDSKRGFYWEGTNANTFSDDLIVTNNFGTPAAQVAYTYTGAQNSSRNRDAVYIGSGTGMSLASAIDLFVTGFETASASPGLSITGTVGDLHVQRLIADACGGGPCVTDSATGFAEITDMYAATGAASTTNVNLAGAVGTHILGGVVISTGSSSIGIGTSASAKNLVISGVRIQATNAGNTVNCITVASTTDSVITDNQCVGTTMGTGINATSSPNNVICGNSVSGSGTNGISLDAASSPNAPCSNNVDPASITNPFVGAGIIPTISSGFGTSPSVVAGSQGPQSFTINVGTGGIATTGIIGLPAARHGWTINSCTDITTQSTTVFMCKQTGVGTTTTAPIGNFNTAGAAAAWVASDILVVSATPY